jgi:hypothetical protein
MAAIADGRFAGALVETAKREGKLRSGFALPAAWSRNTPQRLRAAKSRTATKRGKLRTLAAALAAPGAGDAEALTRMGLDRAGGAMPLGSRPPLGAPPSRGQV